jgi:hypothetical protein
MLKIVLVTFLLSPFVAFAMDEAEIPPPPMPEYMKKNNFQLEEPKPSRKTASYQEPQELDEQSTESIKQEFLQAGQDFDAVEEEATAMPEAEEAPMEELQQVVDTEDVIEEEPLKKPEVAEVNDLEEAEKEFEEAQSETAATSINEPTVIPAEEMNTEPELATLEEKLEEKEQEAEATLAGTRSPSNKKKFKPGMYKFDKDCTMYSEPGTFGDEAGTIRAGRKLWIDAHNDGWHKAYKKSGEVFISSDCLN